MTQYEQINIYLKSKGYKNSKLRAQILIYILDLQKPFSAKNILDSFTKSEFKPNKTTVYRELEMLVGERVLSEIVVQQNQRLYEVNSVELGHHHHLICNQCLSIECVKVAENLETITTEIKQNQGFQIEKHVMEFFGKCLNCQNLNLQN